ncbi:hypothetical protein V3C99_017978, partial [Haemonchus contortus]
SLCPATITSMSNKWSYGARRGDNVLVFVPFGHFASHSTECSVRGAGFRTVTWFLIQTPARGKVIQTAAGGEI